MLRASISTNMTREELTLLAECDNALAAKVALAIIAAANVGPSILEMHVDVHTLQSIATALGIESDMYRGNLSHGPDYHRLRLTFMEVDAVIYARVNR